MPAIFSADGEVGTRRAADHAELVAFAADAQCLAGDFAGVFGAEERLHAEVAGIAKLGLEFETPFDGEACLLEAEVEECAACEKGEYGEGVLYWGEVGVGLGWEAGRAVEQSYWCGLLACHMVRRWAINPLVVDWFSKGFDL